MPAKGATTPAAAPQDVAPDVAVVGGGVIGLAVAWRAAASGRRVTVFDRGALGEGTSRVAAGMLAPVSEADAGEPALLRAGLASAGAWPAFAAELEEASGLPAGHRACGGADGRPRRRRRRLAGARARAARGPRRAGGAAAGQRGASPRAGAGPGCAPRARHPLRPRGPTRARWWPRSRWPASGPASCSGRTTRSPAGTRRGSCSATARAWRRAASSSRRAHGRARPSARSRGRSCGCATPMAPAWSSASCATARTSAAPSAPRRTWCPAATGATCSAPRRRSGAST